MDRSTSNPAAALSLLLQLGRQAREARSAQALGFVMVNETFRILPYRQAALWQAGALPRITAVSGLPEADPNAPYLQWLGRVARTVDAQGSEALRPLRASDLPPELAADWAQWLPAEVLWLRLPNAEGASQGALLLAREEAWTEGEQAIAAEVAHIYAHALLRFNAGRPLPARIADALRPNRRKLKFGLALLALACIPVRLTVLARAEVVPQEPFLVRAPLDGVIDEISVNPNQSVAANTALFRLDATTLASRNALARRAEDAAQESYRQSAQKAVTDDKGKLEMLAEKSRLDEKAIELDYTSQQLARIQVRAPRAGVVVFGDRSDWLGRAVSVGEKVMTLADPNKLEIEAYLPAADSIRVVPGTRLTLYPNAAPTESYGATVTEVAYRAEPTEDSVLAYRIRAHLDAEARLPRIGQMGTARVHGDWVPFFYLALRRPLTWARQWLGW